MLKRVSNEQFQVLSLNVQAAATKTPRPQTQFEVMVRHLFDRLLNNEAFGDDAALRVTQLAYAIALPGLLVALFLYPAYHGVPPHPLHRPFWSQACDHLFFVTYSFVILGTAMVFQWDLLFPDLLDVYVLSSLPIGRTRLLLGRLSALAIFLALVHAETSGLGALFLPGVADVKQGFWRHLAAHSIAVSLGGLCAAAFFVALQGLLVCLPGRRIADRIATAVKAVSVVVLLTILFLFPLAAHYLDDLLGGSVPAAAAQWFPPFWFLGVYESVLMGGGAMPVFGHLAQTAVVVTMGLAALGAGLYPLAYARRVKHLVEGAAMRQKSSPLGKLLQRGLHATVVRTPRGRAIFHFTAQTILRIPRIQLYLSMYAGVGLALVISGLTVLHIDGGRVWLMVSEFGVRSAIPVLAFWTVAGLRTALVSPLGRQGSWIFRVIGGQPAEEEMRGGAVLVAIIANVLTLAAVAILHPLQPPAMSGVRTAVGQVIAAVGLSVLLTDLIFLTVRTIPFTLVRVTTTVELPLILVRFFVAFPAFVLTVVALEPWMAASVPHLLLTGAACAAGHLALRRLRAMVMRREAATGDLLFVGCGCGRSDAMLRRGSTACRPAQ